MHCRLPFLAELLVADVRDTPPHLRSAVEPFELQSWSAGEDASPTVTMAVALNQGDYDVRWATDTDDEEEQKHT